MDEYLQIHREEYLTCFSNLNDQYENVETTTTVKIDSLYSMMTIYDLFEMHNIDIDETTKNRFIYNLISYTSRIAGLEL